MSYGYEKIHAAKATVRDRLGLKDDGSPIVGIVLGSGLGRVGDVLLEGGGRALPYGAIPHFPTSSVAGHKGQLVTGVVDGVRVVVMQGRVHLYEGYDETAVVFPIRVLNALGIQRVVLTNAAGGLQEGMVPGDLMLISDHLNLSSTNPLKGANDERLGPRFPDMSDTYTGVLRKRVHDVAKRLSIELKEGVYAGLLGPSYETPAEIRMLRVLGADAVGMSTVFEAIAASHLGMEVVGISCITNLAAGISKTKLHHDEVKEIAAKREGDFSKLVLSLVPQLVPV